MRIFKILMPLSYFKQNSLRIAVSGAGCYIHTSVSILVLSGNMALFPYVIAIIENFFGRIFCTESKTATRGHPREKYCSNVTRYWPSGHRVRPGPKHRPGNPVAGVPFQFWLGTGS